MKRNVAIALMVVFLAIAAAATFIGWTAGRPLPVAVAVVFLGAGLFMTTQTRRERRPGGPG